jgi:hypothetical protein
MYIPFAWRMTVANSYPGICWVEGKSAASQGASFLEFTDCDDGMERELHQVHTRMGFSGFSFTPLGDILRGFETATNIDDDTTSCIMDTSMIGDGGFHCNLGNRLWLLVIFTASLKSVSLRLQTTKIQILLTSDLALHDTSLHAKKMTLRIA